MERSYVLGLDFGTDSVRALIVDPANGKEIGIAVEDYPRWKDGLYCNPKIDQFRQHPSDYLEAMRMVIKNALKNASKKKGTSLSKSIIGMGIDTTGSTIAAVDEKGTPLALSSKFKENPDGMFILWKDHTAKEEASLINKKVKSWKPDYTRYSGGLYSSEWFFSKILHILRRDKKVRKSAYSWVEHCDWLTNLLVGNSEPKRMMRSRCAAGHKAMWSENWNGLPSQEFLNYVSPLLKNLRGHFYQETYTADRKAGNLTGEWADKLGLRTSVSVAVGAFDAHMGAVGAGIKPKILCKIIGTSSCDMAIVPYEKIGKRAVKGICGQVDGSIMPGYIGMEAGQSSVGDDFAWFRNLIIWSFVNILPKTSFGKNIPASQMKKLKEELKNTIYQVLTKKGRKIKSAESGILALDWFNGRRTPYADQSLRGALIGMNLGSLPPAIYKAIVESTAFGAKRIVQQFKKEGISFKSVIACGGLSKVEYVMQITSDILGLPINVSSSEQTCALGAAIFAAVASGYYKNTEEAQKKMCRGFSKTYIPDKAKNKLYNKLYQQYLAAGKSLEPIMKKL